MPVEYVVCSRRQQCDVEGCVRKVSGPTVVGSGPRECTHTDQKIFLQRVDKPEQNFFNTKVKDPNLLFTMRKWK